MNCRRQGILGKYDSVGKGVYKWFMNEREQNVPIVGHIIREKALGFAIELSITDFKASEGSLGCWKNRHNV